MLHGLLPVPALNAWTRPRACAARSPATSACSPVTIARREEAERHFEDALEVNERMGALPWLAHSRADYARMLEARGDQRARAVPGAALAGYRELGMIGGVYRRSAPD